MTDPHWQEIAQLAVAHGAAQDPAELGPLLEMVAAEKPGIVLEIGSWNGGTLWAWTQLPGPPWVISVDPEPGPVVDFHGATWIKGASQHPWTYRAVVDKLDHRPVDFLFIDGGHTWAEAMTDYWMYRTLVRPGGLIGLHDISQDIGPAAVWASAGRELVETWTAREKAMGMAVFRRG